MNKRGFTLIELLVVIAIIGVLSSVILTSLNIARAKARDSVRRQELHQVQTALSLYYTDNGVYPNTIVGVQKVFIEGNCTGILFPPASVVKPGYGAAGWIPNLVPTYIPTLPGDPTPSPGLQRCFMYSSDGTSYVVWAYNGIESPTFSAGDPMVRLDNATSCTPDPTFTVYGGGAGHCN